jgi:hypothetical protein
VTCLGRIFFLNLANGREIAKYFSGRSIKTIQNVWSAKRAVLNETFTIEKVYLNLGGNADGRMML